MTFSPVSGLIDSSGSVRIGSSGFYPRASDWVHALAVHPLLSAEDIQARMGALRPESCHLSHSDQDAQGADFFKCSVDFSSLIVSKGHSGRQSGAQHRLAEQALSELAVSAWLLGPQSLKACGLFLGLPRAEPHRFLDSVSERSLLLFKMAQVATVGQLEARAQAALECGFLCSILPLLCQRALSDLAFTVPSLKKLPADSGSWPTSVQEALASAHQSAVWVHHYTQELSASKRHRIHADLIARSGQLSVSPVLSRRTASSRVHVLSCALSGVQCDAESFDEALKSSDPAAHLFFGSKSNPNSFDAVTLKSWFEFGKSCGWAPWGRTDWVNLDRGANLQIECAEHVFGRAPQSALNALFTALIGSASAENYLEALCLRQRRKVPFFPQSIYDSSLAESSLARACHQAEVALQSSYQDVHFLAQKLFNLEQMLFFDMGRLFSLERKAFQSRIDWRRIPPEAKKSHLFNTIYDRNELETSGLNLDSAALFRLAAEHLDQESDSSRSKTQPKKKPLSSAHSCGLPASLPSDRESGTQRGRL